MKRRAWMPIAAGLTTVGLLLGGVVAYFGTYGLNAVLRGGPMIWHAVEANDARISPSMRLALKARVPEAEAGRFAWQRLGDGFEVGELPAVVDGTEVDRVLLARIDPAHFAFQVWNRASGDRDALDWMKHLGAVLIINGSYFAPDGTPDTPLLSARVLSGPAHYDARHGAFVASPSFVGIRDLASLDWREAFRGAEHGMVSYPLLIGADGLSRSKGDPRWLANRSFVAQDQAGRIVLGTTVDAFFSLNRFAAFLHTAPLDLKLALNLDGGPVACQAIAFQGFRRDFCGQWEMATDDDELRLLKPLLGNSQSALPIVLAVLPR